MNFLDSIYKMSLEECERNLNFWQKYLDELNSLDFNIFSEKLTVPILVPIGNKILFRGALKHTNEVTVALGADYFAKCSIKQAEILKQHRIKGAQSKVDMYKKEQDFLLNQCNFNNNTHESPGRDIIETCSEDEDKIWREQHRDRLKKYNQSEEKQKELESANYMSDNELWSRLEELELQEELEEEYISMTNRTDDTESNNSFIIKDKDPMITNIGKIPTNDTTRTTEVDSSKIELLQQVITRQKDLEAKLREIKNNEREKSKTEEDLLAKLDELEQLDELEDEMDRLDDMLLEDSDDSEDISDESIPSSKKTVTFADENESETCEIEFKHTDVKSVVLSYNPKIGITKPSDIYEAFSNSFNDETTSILKKSKCDIVENGECNDKKIQPPSDVQELKETIVVKDIIETPDITEKCDNQQRPVSLFKKRRQQQKI